MVLQNSALLINPQNAVKIYYDLKLVPDWFRDQHHRQCYENNFDIEIFQYYFCQSLC